MNPKFRPLYLIAGAIGLFVLVFYFVTNLSNIDPAAILSISLPDFLFFYMAYKTYPADVAAQRIKNY